MFESVSDRFNPGLPAAQCLGPSIILGAHENAAITLKSEDKNELEGNDFMYNINIFIFTPTQS